MIQRMIQVNSVIFGGYLLFSGPMRLYYQKHLTLNQDSSIFGGVLCHFGHTSVLAFAANNFVLYTFGHYIAKTSGCKRLATVAGLGMGVASLLGMAACAKSDGK